MIGSVNYRSAFSVLLGCWAFSNRQKEMCALASGEMHGLCSTQSRHKIQSVAMPPGDTELHVVHDKI